ncbi:MAG: hypothetical protein LW875_05460 [Proteobacteria bacterium]|jgi:chromosome segregation ATPase|nr:hypothetical protein [Pseudomonadota bacterium]
MQKQLNPQLFGPVSQISPRIIEPAPQSQWVEIERKVAEQKVQLQSLMDQWSSSVAQINEFIRSTQARFEKIQQQLIKLEQNDQLLNLEAAQKFAQIQNRIGERKTMDLKIQEMVDRHNTVIRGFEVRVNQMQKMLAEKEAAMVSAQASLNEAKMELARLKRM